MATTAQQMRAHRGPTLLLGGFRPFFLFGAVWSMVAIGLWMPMFEGHFGLPSAFSSLDWHVHEMVFGFAPAIVAGFLLTAIPNWTGRLPVVGVPLALLVALWGLGRVAVMISAEIGAITAAVIDCGFLAVLIGVAGREIVAGRNWRNLRVLAVVALLFAGNVAFHVERIVGLGDHGTRCGIAALVLLMSLVGGRVIPSFSLNWLSKRGPGRLPVPFSRYDGVTLAVSAIALAAWIGAPDAGITGAALAVAGLFQSARLARWAGWRCGAEPLVLVLHLAYAFIPLGFLLMAVSLLGLAPLLPSAALHAWTAGAIGTLTLAIMTRASLGHTGRPLHATGSITAIYAAVIVAALARIAAGFGFAEMIWFHVAMFGWFAAFGGFAIVYWPLLARPK